MRKITYALARILLLGCTLVASGVHADIYMFIDKDGVKNFSNIKLDSRYKPFVFGSKDTAMSPWSAPEGRTSKLNASSIQALTQHPNLKKFEPFLTQAAKDFSVDLALLKAVMAAESRFNPQAVSPKGAIGLMQVMPATAQRYGLSADNAQSLRQKLADPETNIRLGARYLRDLHIMFPSRPELILASYNAGEGAVQKYNNQIPPYPETQNYVQIVTQFYNMYKPSI